LSQKDAIDQREDCGVRTKSDRERKHGGGRETGTTQESADGVPKVATHIVQPTPHPRIAHVLLHPPNAAELESHASARFGLAHATGLQVFNASVHVVAQLAIEIFLDSTTTPWKQVEESSHAPTSPR
jgi:hypothetical protein